MEWFGLEDFKAHLVPTQRAGNLPLGQDAGMCPLIVHLSSGVLHVPTLDVVVLFGGPGGGLAGGDR